MKHASATDPQASSFAWWPVPLLVAAVFAAFWPLHSSAVSFNELDVGLRPGTSPPLTWRPVGGRWEPLAWAALSLQYRIGGGHPRAYHVTSIALHALATVLLYGLAATVLRTSRAAPLPTSPRSHFPSAAIAALAALLFALHPLRVDALGWASNQGLLWSAVLLLAAALLYVRPQRRDHLAAAACYVLSLLFGPSGLLFPFALPLLDRVAGRAPRWQVRAAWLAPAIIAGGLAAWARLGLAPERALSWSTLPALAGRMLEFNVIHAAVPLNLLPAYEWPTAVWSLGSVTGVLVLAALAGAALARRRSALALACGAYVALLLPGVLRIVGPPALQGALTYTPDLLLALLAAAALFRLWQLPAETRAFAAGASIVVLLLAGGLGYFSWLRAPAWRNQTTLWEDANARRPRNALLTLQLARSCHRAEELERAVQLYRVALQHRAALPAAHAGLIEALLALGRSGEAVTAAESFVRTSPDLSLAHRLLGESLAAAGRPQAARRALQQAAGLAPGDLTIARLLARLPDFEPEAPARDG